MNNLETAVAQHYGDGGLLARILNGLELSGAELDNLRPHDLEPVEEFHIGGRKATVHAVEKMGLSKEQIVLDVGCGIGGAARYIAAQAGCRVMGIDLTPEYIDIARKLTELTGLADSVSFEVSSALSMPYDDATFDAGITMHVAMNIPERAALYTEIARVLKPGATFCLFDVMKKNDDALSYPVPWAESEATSHLITPNEMCVFLEDAGFEVREIADRTDFALEFFRQSLEAAASGPKPLGIHTILGESAPAKFKNTLSNIEYGRIAPVQMMAVRADRKARLG